MFSSSAAVFGITPALAGRTADAFVSVFGFKDHPRSRGKDEFVEIPEMTAQGSPPLSREGPVEREGVYRTGRITPALAGRTQPPQFLFLGCGDHPRSRGKDSNVPLNEYGTPGSPPLSREGQRLICPRGQHGGITPALAGRTCRYLLRPQTTRDHPRSRGKDVLCAYTPIW